MASHLSDDDVPTGERVRRRRGRLAPVVLWGLFLLFTVTLALEWAVIFFPVFQLPSPYADLFVVFHDVRLELLDALTFVLPRQTIEYVGVVFSLGGLSISLMMIAARQAITAAPDPPDAPEPESDFGVLTVLQIWIGLVVVVVLWMLATELTSTMLETGSWTPAIMFGTISVGLLLTAWFAGYVRVGPVRFNPLHWVVAALGISYGMTWL